MTSRTDIGRFAPGRDLYEVLGVPRTATSEEIQRSYRRKSLNVHPDKNLDDPDAPEKFKILNQANTILCDPNKRDIYDKVGLYGLKAAEQFQDDPDWDDLSTCQKVGAVSCGIFCGLISGFYCGCCCCFCCCCYFCCGKCEPDILDDDDDDDVPDNVYENPSNVDANESNEEPVTSQPTEVVIIVE